MSPPYNYRILAALPGDSPVELFRDTRPYSQAAWNFVTRELDRAWECWAEYTLADKHCLTERPPIRQYKPPGPKLRVHAKEIP